VQERIIADAEGEVRRLNERFDEERKRFRELALAGARPSQKSANAATR
jgi:hypothetical protein